MNYSSFLTEIIQINNITLIIIAIAVLIIAIFSGIYIHNPFKNKYPYFFINFDVSGKRNPNLQQCIENWLCEGNFESKITPHMKRIENWKELQEVSIESMLFKDHRREQYENVIDDAHAFCFSMYRSQTRYRQSNYQRYSYKVNNSIREFSCGYQWLENLDKELSRIGYECNLSDYESKNQRKLMTKDLRKQIMERDNYTCQRCGKYMPDEVGLHIDHIVPIKRGGKSVPSNLQVLCSKCNGKKSDKTFS